MSAKTKINLTAPLNELGYGQVGKHINSELSKIADVALIPIGGQAVALPHHDGHSLRIWHQNDMMSHTGRGDKIGWPIFELDTFSDVERHHLSYCDKLFVCSGWAKKIIENNGIKVPTYVVPLGVDHNVFYPSVKSTEGTYKFFTCGKWEYRKGHDKILECFEKAFSNDDNVELYMMCHNPFPQVDSKAWERYYRSSSLSSKIHLIDRQPTQMDVANIMRSMDCGVFLSRAEGFNLELLECMACGLDIIYTQYSGHTEFAAGRSVVGHRLEKAEDGVWFNGTGNWLSFDDDCEEQTIFHMRNAYAKREAKDWYSDLTDSLTWENSAQKILTFLLE
jgi:glycosyltransferase involved in cell wall biosynthesis